MKIIRIRRKIESDTLHLPELLPMLGRDVEIIVIEKSLQGTAAEAIEEAAALQGTHPTKDLSEILGGWPEEHRDDDFERAANEWRQANMVDEAAGE